MKKRVVRWMLSAAIAVGIGVLSGMTVQASKMSLTPSLSADDISRFLKDAASQMAAEAEIEANQKYTEYLSSFPTGKVENLQVIDRNVDSVTLFWSNEKVHNAEFFKVDYWMYSNATGTKQTVYLTKNASNGTGKSQVIDNPTSVFELSGLNEGTYTVQITAGNYDSSAPDGRRYEKDALGKVGSNYASITVAPEPSAPTEVNFRTLESGYCSLTVDGVNTCDDTYGVEAVLYDCYKQKEVATFRVDKYQRASGVNLKSDQVVNNRFYGVKTRAYVLDGTTRIYSDWSDMSYAGSKMNSIAPSQKNKQITLKWKEVKGATNNSIYISKSKNRGYKKVATTQNLSQKIKKYNGKALKSDTSYYVKVVANYHKGGDIYKVSSVAKRVTIG